MLFLGKSDCCCSGILLLGFYIYKLTTINSLIKLGNVSSVSLLIIIIDIISSLTMHYVGKCSDPHLAICVRSCLERSDQNHLRWRRSHRWRCHEGFEGDECEEDGCKGDNFKGDDSKDDNSKGDNHTNCVCTDDDCTVVDCTDDVCTDDDGSK